MSLQLLRAAATSGRSIKPAPQRRTSVLDLDPNYYLNTILTPGNGANGSTVLDDMFGSAWTANGNAQISTSNLLYGTGNISLDGSGDYFNAVIPNVIGTGDFTVGVWIRVNSLASDGEIFCISHGSLDLNQFNFLFEVKTSGALRASIQTGASGGVNLDITTAASIIVANTWQYVEFVAEGTTGRIFAGGTYRAPASGSSTITGTRNNQHGSCRIGYLSNGAGGTVPRWFNGRMHDLRVSKVARRSGTASYTPPTGELPRWKAPRFVSNFSASTSNDAQGVANDGSVLYYSSSTTIYRYDYAGTLLSSRNVSGDAPVTKNQINGLYFKSGRLYASAALYSGGVGTSWIVEYDPATLAYVTHWQISSTMFSEGIAFEFGFWWVVFHADKVVAQYDPSWNLVATHNLDFTITGSSGGYGSGQGYDGMAWLDNGYMLANIHETYDQKYCDAYFWNGTTMDRVARLNRPTATATQGLAIDMADPTALIWAERIPAGDKVMRSVLYTGA